MLSSTLLLACALFLGADPPDFEKDTLRSDEPTDAVSINGKSIKEYRDKVKELWPTIVFEKDGKPVEYTVKLETDDGDLELEFYPKEAPNHVRSFIALAKAGFFDGLKFHRVIPEFVIQGGCPKGNGEGGPGYQLKAEFNSIPHDKGVLSMARSRSPDSGGSQFFVVLTRERSQHLDNKYTVFGKVSKGLEVVDKIAARPSNPGADTPADPCKIKKAVVTVKGEKVEK